MRTIEEAVAELRKDIHSDVYLGKKTIGTYLDEILEIHNAEKTEWIPVSERLPEDRREVLVTAYWHETDQVMMASYFGDGLWWCVPFNNCGEHMQRLKPKAWMPLPKPYEPQESDHKCHTCKNYVSGEHDGSCGSYICKGYSNWEREE